VAPARRHGARGSPAGARPGLARASAAAGPADAPARPAPPAPRRRPQPLLEAQQPPQHPWLRARHGRQRAMDLVHEDEPEGAGPDPGQPRLIGIPADGDLQRVEVPRARDRGPGRAGRLATPPTHPALPVPPGGGPAVAAGRRFGRGHVPGQAAAPVVRRVELAAGDTVAAALMPRAAGDAAPSPPGGPTGEGPPSPPRPRRPRPAPGPGAARAGCRRPATRVAVRPGRKRPVSSRVSSAAAGAAVAGGVRVHAGLKVGRSLRQVRHPAPSTIRRLTRYMVLKQDYLDAQPQAAGPARARVSGHGYWSVGGAGWRG
jgi:hypothetical protein